MPQKFVKSRQICQRGSQREGSPSYVLLHSDEENDVDEDVITLANINRTTSYNIMNLQIKSDDTLQALALRYRCTVSGKYISELKRLNKIDKENEIYAKSYIKVPIQPFSLLTEMLAINQESNIDTASAQYEEGTFAEMEQHLTDLNVPSFSEKDTEPSNTEINTIILNSVCRPLPLYNGIDEVLCTENDRLLPQNNDIQNSSAETTDSYASSINMFNCSIDDCGAHSMLLFVFIFIIISLGPLIYIYLYYINEHVKTYNGNVTY